MWRALAGLLIVLMLVVGALQSEEARGHAALAGSDPGANAFLQRAPTRIALTFTEPIDRDQSAIQVLDAAGAPVATSELDLSDNQVIAQVSFPEDLPPGIYNVLWSNVSRIDGHAYRGSFPFTVLNPDGSVPDVVNTVGGLSTDEDPPPLADGVAVRALSLLGLVIAAGGAMLLLLTPSALATDHRRAFERTIYFGCVVLAAATLLNLASLRHVYESGSLREVVFETRSGGYWLMRLGAVAAIAAAVPFIADARRFAAGAGLVATAIYLWAYSVTSHAAAGTGSNWAIAFDLLHGLAAILWMGAVVGIALTARVAGRNANYRQLMPRFGLAASLLVFFLLGTGLISAFIEIDTFDRLWTTRYGWTLVAKLALIVPLLAVAAYNARWGRRAMEAEAPGADRRLVRTSLLEGGLGALVFLTAAMLTQTTVSKSIIDLPDAEPFAEEITLEDGVTIALGIDPNRTGLNTYQVRLTDSAGQLVAADRVQLTFRYRDDQTVGPASLTLQPGSETGTYVGQGPYLTLEGNWSVGVEVRRPDADDVTTFFDVRPAGAGTANLRRGGSWDNPAPGLTWNEFGGFILLIGGLGFAIFGRDLGRLGRPAGWAGNGMTMACFGLGALLLFGVHEDSTDTTGLTNPIFQDQNSIATGRTIYQENCAACHGPRGIPPEGLELNPYPLDLTVHVPQHTDGDIFGFIHDGLPGTAMRAWGEGDDALTDEQIWHVVNFLRTLGTVDE
jgi:copper transport protein